jgi:hypothetical protein
MIFIDNMIPKHLLWIMVSGADATLCLKKLFSMPFSDFLDPDEAIVSSICYAICLISISTQEHCTGIGA